MHKSLGIIWNMFCWMNRQTTHLQEDNLDEVGHFVGIWTSEINVDDNNCYQDSNDVENKGEQKVLCHQGDR